MHSSKLTISAYLVKLVGLIVVLASMGFQTSDVRAAESQIITLTQTGCQFLEPENTDHGYMPETATDCETINDQTRVKRLAQHSVLSLKPGAYIFRVTNKNVPYERGFYLRSADRALIPFNPRVSGAGLFEGQVRDYKVELKEGEYVYSCPYNPTPNYKLVVR